jgi:type IV pilus assembly protein PilY1
VVIFGNGYNSENSSAELFVLDPADGSILKQIDTGVTNCNGLSSPVLIDVDFDDRVDYVFAGDLHGNLWKFDFTSTDYNDWGVAYGTDNDLDGMINFLDGDVPQPVFQGQENGGAYQPITCKPDVMFHCKEDSVEGGYMVIFGTGKYLGSDDIDDTSQQAVYGIWDYGDDLDDTEYLGQFDSGATPQLSNQANTVTLLEQTADDYTVTINVDTDGDGTGDTPMDIFLRVMSDNDPDWTTTTSSDGSSTGCQLSGGLVDCDPNGTGTHPDLAAHGG